MNVFFSNYYYESAITYMFYFPEVQFKDKILHLRAAFRMVYFGKECVLL